MCACVYTVPSEEGREGGRGRGTKGGEEGKQEREGSVELRHRDETSLVRVSKQMSKRSV